MKTLTLKLSVLILIIGLSFNAFTQTINIDSTFYADTQIYPFSQVDSIYSLNMSGNITLNSDTSLIRIILTDTLGNEYMIYEAYPLITSEMNFSIYDECDETCYLNEFNPNSLIIYTIDASIYINNLSYSTIPCENCESQQYDAKRQKDFGKIQLMNINIIARGMDWVAGDNSVVQSYNYIKERKYGYKYNIQGFDYYETGIFEFISAYPVPENNTSIVKEFDWRNRHGANIIGSPYYGEDFGWITPFNVLPGQGDCAACWAFAPIAVFETVLNLYYNNHYDFALSEQEVISCSNGGDCDGGYVNIVMIHFKLNGAKFYECYEYLENDTACDDLIPLCSDPNENFKIAYWGNIDKTELAIKEHLINYGPITMGWTYTGGGHVMALIGYSYDSNENKTNWVFRNSDPSQIITMKLPLEIISYLHYLREPIPNLNNQPDCHCFDNDNDGWHNWGIGDNHNICIGDNIPVQIDSDDNNRRIGPYDENYYGVPVKPEMIVEHNNLEIENGGFLTFYENSGNIIINITIRNEGNAQLNFYPEDIQPIPDEIVSSSNPDVFEITSIPPANIEMNGGETTFQITYHYTSGPGNDNAVITINTLEFDFEPFKFFIENNDCYFNPEVEEISEIVNWPDWAVKSSNVLIKDGAELNITGNYGFVKDASIFIEPGGKVTIDGGVLTKACLNKWQGIDVWGNTNLSQYPTSNQGYIKIINNGSIRNAETGIQAAQIINGLYVSGTTGGIISCYDAIFKDNISDIIIYPFENTNPGSGEEAPNFCSFTNTQFINTTVCEHDPYVNLWGVDGIKFRGCSFINELIKSDCPCGYNKGTGIRSFSSGFYVDDYCVNNTVPCDETKQCYFENLEYGIYAFNGELSKYISIDTTVFVNNKTGIYMSMVENQTITQNKFIYDDTHDLLNDITVGLYLETCTGYTVEENIFSNNAQNLTSLGIQILNSGSAYNEIYNNTFENISCGISAAGENRAETGEGLCIKCNDFTDCVTDIYVTPDGGSYPDCLGIATNQGELGSLAPPGISPNAMAAGNTFTSDDFLDIEYNYYNHPDLDWINYIHHPDQAENKLRPNPFNKVNREEDPEVWYSKEESCHSNLGSGIDILEEKSILSTETIQITAYNDTLNQLVDGGDTESLNFEVQTSFPDEALQVRQQLLDESPYLSDTVMKSAIYKENVLPNAMVRDVLVANPQSAKSAEVINVLDDRFVPMPDYMMAEIMGGLNITGTKEVLERKLAKHSSTRAKSLSKLLRHYKNDTLNTWANDSIMALLQNEQSPCARYQLAFIYLDMEDSLSVVNTLTNIPVEFTLDDNQQTLHDLYDDLFDVLLDIQTDSLVLDSINIQTLQDIAANHNNLPGVYARNMLIDNGLMSYQEPVYLPDNLKSSPAWEYFKQSGQTQGSLLRIFPNPAGSYFIIDYDLRELEGTAMILISDITGKHVLNFYLEDRQNQRVITTKAYPTGMYFIQLFVNGELKESSKINIIK